MDVTRPRVVIDLRPVVFATALARVLEEQGYEVDFDTAGPIHDLAIVDEDGEAPATVQIRIPALDGSRHWGWVSRGGSSDRVAVGSLQDLLGLIGAMVPLADGFATGGAG
jgi:hypothetical protein